MGSNLGSPAGPLAARAGVDDDRVRAHVRLRIDGGPGARPWGRRWRAGGGLLALEAGAGAPAGRGHAPRGLVMACRVTRAQACLGWAFSI